MKRKRSTRNRSLFFRILLFFAVVVLVNGTILPQAQTKTIDVQKHPNHYILLIDASGSTVSNEAKVKKYKEILMVELLNHLYRDGFGELIPPFNPEEDLLSTIYFGIVPQGYDQPYLYLANYDLLNDFVRPRIIRQKGISQKKLVNMIWPGDFFKLTILAWAKPMALASLLRNNFEGISNRVFLIMVHDGILNDGTLRDEIKMAESWSNQDKLENVKKAIDRINANYMFSDGKGQPRWAWNKRFTDSDEPIFLEAYQVISMSHEKWLSHLKELKPVAQLKFHWTRESGNEPEGYVKVNVDEEFFKYLENQNTSAALTFTHQGNKKLRQLEFASILKFPVIFSQPLNCKPMECQVELDIPFSRQDKLLGKSNMTYHYRGKVQTPIPFRCSVSFVAHWVIIGLIVIAFLVFGLWFCYFRFYVFPIKIRFPGLSFPISVKRNKNITGSTPVHPKPGMTAFTIHLPLRLIQFILLKKATVNLNHKDKQNGKKEKETKEAKEIESRVYWVNDGKKSDIIGLPAKRKRINIWWETIPKKPLDLTISFSQEKHKSEIQLYFPKGIPGGGEK